MILDERYIRSRELKFNLRPRYIVDENAKQKGVAEENYHLYGPYSMDHIKLPRLIQINDCAV